MGLTNEDKNWSSRILAACILGLVALLLVVTQMVIQTRATLATVREDLKDATRERSEFNVDQKLRQCLILHQLNQSTPEQLSDMGCP